MSSVYRPHLWWPTTAGCMRGSVAHSGGFYHLRHHLGLYPSERGWHMSCTVACELIKKPPFRSSWPVFLTHQPTQNEGGDFCCILSPHKQFRNENTNTHTNTHHQSWQPSRRTPRQSATKVGTVNLIDEQSVNQWERAADSLCSYKSRASCLLRLLISSSAAELSCRWLAVLASRLQHPPLEMPQAVGDESTLQKHTWSTLTCRHANAAMVDIQKTDNTCPGRFSSLCFPIFLLKDPAKTKMGGKYGDLHMPSQPIFIVSVIKNTTMKTFWIIFRFESLNTN